MKKNLLKEIYVLKRKNTVFLFLMLLCFQYGFSKDTENNTSLVATIEVTNTNNTGMGSLRQAITDANGTPAADVIEFNIPGVGPHIIALTTALPNISKPVTIDGSTQPGFVANTAIYLQVLTT